MKPDLIQEVERSASSGLTCRTWPLLIRRHPTNARSPNRSARTRSAMSYLRKISFWYLTMFVLFSVGKDFQVALTFTRSTDHAVFHAAGVGSAFPACLAASLVLDLAASYYVFRPKPFGFWVLLLALAFAAIYNLVAFDLASDHLEATKAAYVASRELRGLPTNPEMVNKVFSPEGRRATLGMALFFALSSLGALAANRWRFFPPALNHHGVGGA